MATDSDPSLLASHEARLGRVEDAVNECNVTIGQTNTKLEHIDETLKEGFAALKEQLKGIPALEQRVEVLEAAKKARTKKLSATKAAAGGIALAGIGAFIEKFGEHIASMLGFK